MIKDERKMNLDVEKVWRGANPEGSWPVHGGLAPSSYDMIAWIANGMKEAYRMGLEDAAEVCDKMQDEGWDNEPGECAEKIRELK